MKRILGLALFSILFTLPVRAENVNGTEITKTAAAVAFTQDIDLASYKGASVQAVYADGTPAAFNVSDGAKANATLTVLSSTSLLGNTISVGTVTVTFGGAELSTGPATGNSAVIIATTVASALRVACGNEVIFSTGLIANGATSIVVATTSLVDGSIRYVSASSTNTSWGTPFFVNGSAPGIDVTTDIWTYAAHGLTTGLRVWVSTSAGTVPTGLTAGTSYYAIYLTPDTFAVATTSTTAVAGTKVDVTALGGSSTVGVHPLALATTSGNANNTPAFKWQASNDGTNYYDLAIASVSYSAAGNYLWDLGTPNYRYLRMNFAPPTAGGLAVSAIVNGKR